MEETAKDYKKPHKQFIQIQNKKHKNFLAIEPLDGKVVALDHGLHKDGELNFEPTIRFTILEPGNLSIDDSDLHSLSMKGL